MFNYETGSNDRAVLLYEYVGRKTVDLQHTEVPDAYRGRGIAKHLAKVIPVIKSLVIIYRLNLSHKKNINIFYFNPEMGYLPFL